MNKYKWIRSAMLVFFMLLVLVVPGIRNTMADPDDGDSETMLAAIDQEDEITEEVYLIDTETFQEEISFEIEQEESADFASEDEALAEAAWLEATDSDNTEAISSGAETVVPENGEAEGIELEPTSSENLESETPASETTASEVAASETIESEITAFQTTESEVAAPKPTGSESTGSYASGRPGLNEEISETQENTPSPEETINSDLFTQQDYEAVSNEIAFESPPLSDFEPNSEGIEEDDDDDGVVAMEARGAGSISGFLWVDGNGMMPTDWDGLYNGDEQPLSGFSVYLYAAGDLTHALAVSVSGTDGVYSFNGLEPGSYVLGFYGASVAGIDYLAPVFITSENKFEIDWSISGLPAYTEVIVLGVGQAVQGINGGLRLPMGVQPMRLWNSISGLMDSTLRVNDEFTIDNRTWIVVRIQNVQGESGQIRAVYLILRGARFSNRRFGASTNYATSEIRDRMTTFFAETGTNVSIPTIRALALKPNLGVLSSQTATTEPTGQMAGDQTEDILFAPSYRDMLNWTGRESDFPSNHPLSYYSTSPPFPTRFWFRTPSSYSNVEMVGYFRLANRFDHGIHINGTTEIWDVPGVWVNANAINRDINVYYIDSDGNQLRTPFSTSVLIGNSYTLPPAQILNIDDYEYIEWRRGISGVAQPIIVNPNLTAQNVMDGTDLYLVYERTGPTLTDVTVSKEVIDGSFGSATKPFTFTIHFVNSANIPLNPGTTFSYIGGVIGGIPGITAPPNGTLTLDWEGKASFVLLHGQMITIRDVPSDIKIKILEHAENAYLTTYTDSKYAGVFDVMEFDTVGTDARTLGFKNKYVGNPIVPTGIDNGTLVLIVLPPIALALLLSVVVIAELVRKRTLT